MIPQVSLKLVQHLLAGPQYEDRAGVIGIGETANSVVP